MSTKDKIEHEIATLQQLLVDKNADYGDSALKASPLVPGVDRSTGILIRIGDKFERLQTLARNEARVDETFEDTIRDLAGYCVMYLVSRVGDDQSTKEKAASETKTTDKPEEAPSVLSRVGRRSKRGS